MAIRRLVEAVTDDGIRWTNFFNGRLLSAEDLSREQDSQRRSRRDLGRAAGEGVATGLGVAKSREATPESPRIRIDAGLAVNRRGQTLRLAQDIELSLESADDPAATPAGDFEDCMPPQGGPYVAGAGAYLLVMAPASRREGRAPTSGLGNAAAGCGTKFLVEGVQFRLVPIPLAPEELAEGDLLRSRLAHRCFGIGGPGIAGAAVDPFGPGTDRYGLVDEMREAFLTECDVPLALVAWSAAEGVRFVDRWSVRRRLTRPSIAGRFAALVDDRRFAESEAMFLQFEEQIEDLYGGAGDPASLVADDHFRFLPPAGLVPILGGPSARGFDAAAFFGDRASRDVAMTDAALIRPLLRESFLHEPIDLDGSEPIQLYLIWENFNAVQAGLVGQLALVFASATLPYRGVARFGDARWDLSRFAPTPI